MNTKRSLLYVLATALIVAVAGPLSRTVLADDTTITATTTAGNGGGFVDLNGDGVCDNLRDSDNDGVPNCQDPDWTRPQDGAGIKNGNQYKRTNGQAQGGGLRKGAGTQKQLRDGSCTLSGTGTCDGTGPKGLGKGKGRK